MSSRMRALTLKRKVDDDIDMQDVGAQTQTVEMLVTKKVEQALREHNLGKKRKHTPTPVDTESGMLTHAFRKENSSTSTQRQGETQSQDQSAGQGTRSQKEEEVCQQVAKVERAFRGVLGSHLRVSTSSSSLVRTTLGTPLTDVRRRDRAVVSTHEACIFLDRHSELFSDVSSEARRMFVAKHTPVHLFEVGHRFAKGVFKGPGVSIPLLIEYKLALNSKFVLHHSPNILRV